MRRVLLLLMTTASVWGAEVYTYTKVPGTLKQISGHTQLWGVNAAGEVYQWTTNTWVKRPGSFIQVSTGDKYVFGLTAAGNLLEWDSWSSTWKAPVITAPKPILQISVGRDGTVAAVVKTATTVAQRYRPGSSTWTTLDTSIAPVQLANGGMTQGIWARTSTGAVYSLSGTTWQPIKGTADHIAADGATLYRLSKGLMGKWNGSSWTDQVNTWSDLSPASAQLFWLLDPFGSIFRGDVTSSTSTVVPMSPIITTTATISINTPTPALPPVSYSAPALTLGSLVCMDPGRTDSCGFEKADKVGVYTLNMNCPAGFYDPIYGGTCWKCPDDDGAGPFIRSLTAVTASDACWRVPKETVARATKVSKTMWAWECGGGTFWDGYDWGGCWKCPDTHPRRTLAAVYEYNACASPLNETRPASMLSFNGCPTPDPTTMGLTGKRVPGKPFLDIGAGWAQGQASGLCYACPVMDKDGNMLITDRNARSVMGTDGCSVRFKWKPPYFPEPGIAAFNARNVILESKMLDPVAFTKELYAMAAEQKIPDTEAKAWVTKQWQEIAATPYKNTSVRIALYFRLLQAVKTDPAQRTANQTTMVNSVQEYIRSKKMYFAREALSMYDKWKAVDQQYRDSVARNPYRIVFNYGTVPLDFQGMMETVMVPMSTYRTGQSAMLLGFAGATAGSTSLHYLQVAKAIEYFRSLEVPIEGVTTGVNAAKTGQVTTKILSTFLQAGGGYVGAAAIANIAMLALQQVAMEQFLQIITARPKLEAAVAAASQPVDLRKMLGTANDFDVLKFYWSKAIDDAQIGEDPELVKAAAAAATEAQRLGYPIS